MSVQDLKHCSYILSLTHSAARFLFFLPHLIIDQKLHRVVPPLDEHQFIGLSGCRVRKWRPQAGPHARLDPKTQSQSEDLLQQRLLYPPVHVVGSHGEADLEGIGTLGTCFWREITLYLDKTISPQGLFINFWSGAFDRVIWASSSEWVCLVVMKLHLFKLKTILSNLITSH